MGKLLEQYLAENVPQLQDIVAGGPPRQPGARTFPLPEQPGMRGQPIGPGGQPTGPMAAMPGPGANLQTAPVPSFDQPAPQSAMPGPPPQPQQDRSAEFAEGEDSFIKYAKDENHKKNVKKAVDAMEESGVDIDQAYEQTTGGPAKKGMTREEKGMILMEFGLTLMAQSGTGEGTFGGDIGIAGMAAFRGHQGRKAARAKGEIEAQEREQERRLKEAQIKKAERADTSVEEDASGNLIIVNKQTGETKAVTIDGEPVKAGDEGKFASEVDRQAYEELECTGLKGSALKACRRRALAYGKGGGAKVAFPELERGDQVDRVMRNLEDPDNASKRYKVPSRGGEAIRWKQMTPDEQMEVAEGFVDRRIAIINRGRVETNGRKPAKDTANETAQDWVNQLSPEERKGMVSGKIYTLSNGKRIRKRDGKFEEVK